MDDGTSEGARCDRHTLLTGQRPAEVLKIRLTDLHDGALHISQNKTCAKRAIEVTHELAHVVEGINARQRERVSAFRIQDHNGQPLTMARPALALRQGAGVWFQFRDIRAKTASNMGDLGHSQQLIGHKNRDIT